MEWQIKEKEMQKLKDLVNAEFKVSEKYKNIEDMPEEEYRNFRQQRKEFAEETGLSENELSLLIRLRVYKLTIAVNTLVYRIIDQIEKTGTKPTEEFGEITGYKEILLL